MSDFDKYEYKNILNEDSTSETKKIDDDIEDDFTYDDEPGKEFYYQTIKEKSSSNDKKTSWIKFLVAILIVSIVGGSFIGVSYSFIEPFAKSFITDKFDDVIPETVVDEDKPKFEFKDEPKDVVVSQDDGGKSPVVQIAKKVGPSVVSIINTRTIVDSWNREFTEPGLGSGIIFDVSDDKVHIITNSHVVEGSTSLAVTFLGNTRVPAKLVGNDTTSDIAVVSVNKDEIPEEIRPDLKPAPMGDSDALEVGELAVAIGNPVNEAYHNTITSGVISALNREIQLPDKQLNLIQTDAAINPGNSGGALVGSAGNVIGINTIKLVDSQIEGMGFAIPINDVKPIVEELMNSGEVLRPYLGIIGADVTEETAALLDFPIGIYVKDVMEGSGAYAAGLQEGDIIIEFDGEKISSMKDLSSKISRHKPNAKVPLTFLRNNKRKQVTVKLLPQNNIESNQNIIIPGR
ncbi:MAG: PDZ domain-containing protein [Epulopiscium sp.]|nr:PDZ domain-containing protein [Candidatus Epulonipiscium sp.]